MKSTKHEHNTHFFVIICYSFFQTKINILFKKNIGKIHFLTFSSKNHSTIHLCMDDIGSASFSQFFNSQKCTINLHSAICCYKLFQFIKKKNCTKIKTYLNYVKNRSLFILSSIQIYGYTINWITIVLLMLFCCLNATMQKFQYNLHLTR